MKHTPQIECASHLSEMLTHGTADLAITRAIKLIKELMRGIDGAPRLTFDSIACSGISGLLFAPPVARKLKKSLIIVRKRKGEHSHTMVEGDRNAKRYIVLDDLICSGTTLERIASEIAKEIPGARCAGFLGYSRLVADDETRRADAWRTLDEIYSRNFSATVSAQYRAEQPGSLATASLPFYSAWDTTKQEWVNWSASVLQHLEAIAHHRRIAKR